MKFTIDPVILANTDIMVDLVRKLEDPSVALAHQVPFVCDQRGFMNAIEKVSRHSTTLPAVIKFKEFTQV